MPFASPEIFSNPINYNPRIDVFSFGVLMCEFLFDLYIVDFKRNNLAHLQKKYCEGNYKIKLLEENMKLYGPKHLMKTLRNLILKCIEYEPNSRAHIEWIALVLKECFLYLERIN